MVPITDSGGIQAPSPIPPIAAPTTAIATNVDATSLAAKYACYIHQCLCFPQTPTLLGALKRSEELATTPGLTPQLIKSHLLRSTATNKGPMRRHSFNTASTGNAHDAIVTARTEVDHMFPQQELCAVQDVFCFTALADTITGTMYTDITGAFPVCSFKSRQYIFVVYVYDLNAIIVRAMPSRTDAAMVMAFNEVISTLKTGGYTPTLNVMDNKCLAAVEAYIKSERIGIQLVPPHNHCVNAVECAIATFKEHFIAALATVDAHCPLQLRDEFLPLVELTLNMLRFSRRDPKKSANQEVYGTFDFSKTPLTPIGTKALIYDDPASRASWAPHATDGFYVGPAPDHYRCLRFYIPATRRFRFSDTWRIYPMHSEIPMTSQYDLSIVAAADLSQALGTTVPTSATAKHKYIRVIEDLMAIMAGQQATQSPIDLPDTRMEAASQRVGHATPLRVATISNNITAPDVIRTMKNAVSPPAPHTQQQSIPDPSN